MRYFQELEFKMGNEIVFDKMNTDFLELLDNLRECVSEPLHINSSYRSKTYNDLIGGSKNSQHLTGNAVDLHCDNGTLRLKIIENALAIGLTVGIAKNFVHIDNRLKQIEFTY